MLQVSLSKKQKNIVSALILIIINLVAIWYFSANYQTNAFFPNEENTNLPIRLYYPPPDNDQLEPIMVSLWFNVTANGTIAENTPIELTNFTGHVYTANNDGIDFIGIGFFHTNLNEGHTYDIITGEGPVLMPVGIQCTVQPCDSALSDLIIWHQQPPFSFPVGGDYSPTIIITMGNKTIQHTYTEIKIHVATQSELQTKELDRINAFITVSLLIFGDIELVWLFYEWQKNTEDKHQNKPLKKEIQTMGYS
jgi:hypothetical protein